MENTVSIAIEDFQQNERRFCLAHLVLICNTGSVFGILYFSI